MSNEPMPTGPDLPPDIPSTPEDRSMGMLCHIGGIFGFIVPLVVWLMKKDQSKFVDDQGKEALNFQILVVIGMMISFASMIVVVGLLLLPAVVVINIVFSIMGGLAANKGTVYRYPYIIRLIK